MNTESAQNRFFTLWRVILAATCATGLFLPNSTSGQLPARADLSERLTNDEELANLRRRLSEIEQELDQLRQLPAVGSASLSNPITADPIAPLPAADSYPTVRVGGFFHADAALLNQSATNIATVGDGEDGADFRRARLLADGDLAENVAYRIEFDFGFPGRPSFMDVWVELNSLPVLGNLRVGHFRAQYGMDEMSSARRLMFLERHAGVTFGPFRQTGVTAYDAHEPSGTTWAASVFRFPTDQFGGNTGDAGGYSMTTRFTTLVWESEHNDRLVHVGLGYLLTDPSDDQTQFRSRPEVFVSEQRGALAVPDALPFFVDTRPIPTNLYQGVNLEGGTRYRSWSTQAEWRVAHVDQIGGPDLTFHAAYGQIGYVLTGETRNYVRSQGVFGGIIPDRDYRPGRGSGAWETAARISWINLDDANINGNEMTTLTWGLNWYLNKHTTFQFNYIHPLLNPRDAPNSSANIIAARVQAEF